MVHDRLALSTSKKSEPIGLLALLIGPAVFSPIDAVGVTFRTLPDDLAHAEPGKHRDAMIDSL